jgi:hypothetical protein
MSSCRHATVVPGSAVWLLFVSGFVKPLMYGAASLVTLAPGRGSAISQVPGPGHGESCPAWYKPPLTVMEFLILAKWAVFMPPDYFSSEAKKPTMAKQR